MPDATRDAEGDASPPDVADAIEALKQPGKSAGEVEAAILDLISSCTKTDRAKLLDALAALPLAMFVSLKTIFAALEIAERGKRTPDFVTKFEGFRAAGAPTPLWSHDDRLKRFKNKFDQDIADLLLSIKYAQSPEQFDDVEAAAEYYAPRFVLADAIVDTLYEHSTMRGSNRNDFAAKVRQGFVVEHVLNDLCRRRRGNDAIPSLALDYEGVLADDWRSDPTRTTGDHRHPAVFLTCHTGTLDHVKVWFKTLFDDGVRLGNGASDKIMSSRENPNAALLSAYRAVMAGNPLLIAADSPQGAAKNTLSVFGREVPVADGFVFLAYESKADVFWTLAVPEDGRLAIQTVRGPSREEGESLKAYRPRLLRFVEERIEAYLSGPPEHIGLRKKWLDTLA